MLAIVKSPLFIMAKEPTVPRKRKMEAIVNMASHRRGSFLITPSADKAYRAHKAKHTAIIIVII